AHVAAASRRCMAAVHGRRVGPSSMRRWTTVHAARYLGRVIRASWLFVLTLLLPFPVFSRQPPEACPARRYVVTAGAGQIAAGSDAPVIVALAESHVAVAGGCSPTRQRVRTKRKGTKIALRWKACADRSDVRLKATLDTGCATMLGKVRARRL